MTLEQQLIDLCEQHRLTHISLNVTKHGGEWMLYVHAQNVADGVSRAGSSGYDLDKFAPMIPEALAALAKDTPRELPPIEGLAA